MLKVNQETHKLPCDDCTHREYCWFYSTDCGEDFSGYVKDTSIDDLTNVIEILPDEEDREAINDWYEAHDTEF